MRAAASAAGARLGEEAAFEWALDEACDAAAGLGALIRCTPTTALVTATDVPALLGYAGDFAGALCTAQLKLGAVQTRRCPTPIK